MGPFFKVETHGLSCLSNSGVYGPCGYDTEAQDAQLLVQNLSTLARKKLQKRK